MDSFPLAHNHQGFTSSLPSLYEEKRALQCLRTSHRLLLQFFCPSFSLERRASRYSVEYGPKWPSTLMKFLLSLSFNLHSLANFVFYSIQCFSMLDLRSVFSQNLWATLGLWGDKHSSWTHTPVGECLTNVMSAYARSADQEGRLPVRPSGMTSWRGLQEGPSWPTQIWTCGQREERLRAKVWK